MAAPGSSAAHWCSGCKGRGMNGSAWAGAAGRGGGHPPRSPHAPDDTVDHSRLGGRDELVVGQEAGALGFVHTRGFVV